MTTAPKSFEECRDEAAEWYIGDIGATGIYMEEKAFKAGADFGYAEGLRVGTDHGYGQFVEEHNQNIKRITELEAFIDGQKSASELAAEILSLEAPLTKEREVAATVQKLVEALKYYSNANTYKHANYEGHDAEIWADEGKKAIKALAEWENK